ncbi:GmrSD restriction endonuclease domain-containing protein [Microbacterium kunmingense]|uniref:GmrSD restriction endonuclease domain-containing protein n=1 Tax=Microbacterium kunmingense TaxID=2915939 RepID=UPI00200398B4|nr:DUF262 domain-containing protein [Microbacterium kunmingense]
MHENVNMQPDLQTPMKVFGLPQHLVVPIYQRPYVWKEDDQWAPLWHDVRRMAELRLGSPQSSASHFLGAVVLQMQEASHGSVPASNVIDGQQRLTTLQLLMDAAGAVLDEFGEDTLSGRLANLTHNQPIFVPDGESPLKLRHTNRDALAFDEVMNAEPPVDHRSLRHSGSRIVQAHAYFVGSCRTWLDEAAPEGRSARASALVSVLEHGLHLVTITLTAGENSQEIFETLNARGTPLSAADLIRNFVFQKLVQEGVDTTTAHKEHWPFETDFWEREVSVGRYFVSRSSLFFNQWLASRTGEEISPLSTFTRFKTYVEHESDTPLRTLLPVIRSQADLYEAWTRHSEQADRQLSPVEMCMYRMRSNSIEVLKPAMIWLHEPDLGIAQHVADAVIAVLESWVMRRLLLRLTTSDLGRIVADVIKANRDAAPDELESRVRSHLERLNRASTYWPGDEELREALRTDPVYRRFNRGRLRVILEAVENRFRSFTNQPQVPRRGYPIEHVLPQKWEDNWPVPDEESAAIRADHIHRLGNLTLLTTSLNSKVSNGPWEVKREAFQEHDTLLLTSRLLKSVEGADWDESTIDARTDLLTDALLAIWPVSPGHIGAIADPQSRVSAEVTIRDLIKSGALSAGTRLRPRHGDPAQFEAVVAKDGRLRIGEEVFATPSGAGAFALGRAVNGWYFWFLPDGRLLEDLRAIHRGQPVSAPRFDWAPLHAILEAIPPGRWTTYGALAEVIGTAAQPLGAHVADCQQCTNAYRVLTSDGRVSGGFRWSDSEAGGDPIERLVAEGVLFQAGRASREHELTADELAELLTEE